MITMTTNIEKIIADIQSRVRSVMPGGSVNDSALRAAASTQLALCIQRIHVDGKASDGSAIGEYSTKETYISGKSSPVKLDNEGRTGRRNFESSGQPHTSKYFEGGYKAFRSEIGRDSSKVVLDLSGQLKIQLSIIPTNKGYGLGWPNVEMRKRAGYLELKYRKKIWRPTESEETIIIKIIQKAVLNALSGSHN